MKNILIPVDFSKGADNACKYGIEIARKTKAKIILMHVFETPVLYPEVPLEAIEMDYNLVYKTALGKLKKYYNKISLRAPEIKFELVLQQGLASSGIIDTALEKKADMIVMSTTGKGAIERALIGSNTLRVIRKAPCSVMVIPPKAKFSGLKTMVYATDLQTDNLKRISRILPFAEVFNSEIHFLNIDSAYTGKSPKEKVHDAEQIIKKYFHYPKVAVHIIDELNIARAIEHYMAKSKSDCLITYTRNKNILQSIIQFHISKELAIHASFPLMVIHKKDFVAG